MWTALWMFLAFIGLILTSSAWIREETGLWVLMLRNIPDCISSTCFPPSLRLRIELPDHSLELEMLRWMLWEGSNHLIDRHSKTYYIDLSSLMSCSVRTSSLVVGTFEVMIWSSLCSCIDVDVLKWAYCYLVRCADVCYLTVATWHSRTRFWCHYRNPGI